MWQLRIQLQLLFSFYRLHKMIKGVSLGIFVYVWMFIYWIRPTSTTLTVTAYDGTGIVQQQPLTLGCNYTKGGSDQILDFSWRLGSVIILSGSVSAQTSNFLQNTNWTTSGVFLGDHTSSLTIQLPASSVTPNVAGQYTCSVNTLTGRVLDYATANVQYTPQIKSNFPSSRTVTQFSRLQIDCSSYITPGNPSSTSYTWTYGGSTISSGAALDINNIGRDRRGQYTCTASNTVGYDSETVSVDVQYGPQIESTFPSSRTVTEFSRLQIDCSSYTTQGNPPTTSYTWTYGGSTISSGAVWDISNIRRDRRGQYTCTASNAVGSDSETVSVDVLYLDRPELPVNKTEVMENETVSLTCNVESNPTAELEIRSVDNNMVLVERDTDRLQFTIDRVQCLHNGSFLCTARNTQIGNSSYSALREIDVKCLPRQDFRQKLDSTVFKQINETAVLVANVIANPVPVFRWFKHESGGLTSISRDTIHSIRNSRLQSVLYINISRTQDYGDYVLEMENSQGSNQLLFTLTSKVPSTSNSSNVGVIAGVVTAVCHLTVLVLVLFFLYRRGVLRKSRCFKSEKRGPLTSNPVGEVQGNSELTLASASPYSDLDHKNSETQAYAELKIYQNNQVIADYEESSVLPGNKSPTYENTDMKNKDSLYLNVSCSKQTI